MTILLAICAVMVTVAGVAVAIAVIRAAARFDRVTVELEQSAQAFRAFAAQAQTTGREVQQFVANAREIIPPVRRAAEAFGSVGERAADLGTVVLSEVEAPVRRTANLLRGVRAGATYFLSRLTHSNGHTTKNGGPSDER